MVVVYTLHILTHGRRYREEYPTLEEAVAAAVALSHEPRERAEQITCGQTVVLDREAIEERVRRTE